MSFSMLLASLAGLGLLAPSSTLDEELFEESLTLSSFLLISGVGRSSTTFTSSSFSQKPSLLTLDRFPPVLAVVGAAGRCGSIFELVFASLKRSGTLSLLLLLDP